MNNLLIYVIVSSLVKTEQFNIYNKVKQMNFESQGKATKVVWVVCGKYRGNFNDLSINIV